MARSVDKCPASDFPKLSRQAFAGNNHNNKTVIIARRLESPKPLLQHSQDDKPIKFKAKRSFSYFFTKQRHSNITPQRSGTTFRVQKATSLSLLVLPNRWVIPSHSLCCQRKKEETYCNSGEWGCLKFTTFRAHGCYHGRVQNDFSFAAHMNRQSFKDSSPIARFFAVVYVYVVCNEQRL